jgi:hypothetical protein
LDVDQTTTPEAYAWCLTGSWVRRVSLWSGGEDYPDLESNGLIGVSSAPRDFATGDVSWMPLLAASTPSAVVLQASPLQVLVSTDHPGALRHAPDIDGDGRSDLVIDSQYILTHADGAVPYPLPGHVGADLWVDRAVPLPDVTGDGYGDLLSGPYTDCHWFGYIYSCPTSHMALYPGGPDGYATTPLWETDLPRALMEAVALQLDEDPELEIMALGHVMHHYDVDTGLGHTVHIFDDVNSTPVHSYFEMVHSRGGPGSKLFNVGDLDGDGLDDVLVTSPGVSLFGSPTEPFDLLLLGSSVGYDPSRLLQTFVLEGGSLDSGFSLEVADITDDGELDIVVGFNGAINVFYGPLYVAPPVPDTAATDTGAPPSLPTSTGDTGESSPATDSTAPSASTAPTSTADGADTKATDGCGCHALPAPSSLAIGVWLLPMLWRRRCGG